LQLVLAIALLGLVMVTLPSVSIASKDTGQTFFYSSAAAADVDRRRLPALLFCVRTELLEEGLGRPCSRAIVMLALCSSRDLPHGERQPPLAATGRSQFQAIRAGIALLVLIYLAS